MLIQNPLTRNNNTHSSYLSYSLYLKEKFDFLRNFFAALDEDWYSYSQETFSLA